jgi:precorrin-2 dehydrogenase / sirohydrochlorin ferrochelatase
MSNYYPIFLGLKDKKCVVVGGGNVALRKICTLLECHARVNVISPVLCKKVKDLARTNKIKVSLRKYRKGDLRKAFIAVIATNDEYINEKITEEAYKERVLLNVVDNPDISDFIVPSILNRGDLTIAVSTGGKSPALARKIRMKLEGEIGEEYARLVEIVNDIRIGFKRDKTMPKAEVWQKGINLNKLIPLIKSGEEAKAEALLKGNLTKYLNK